MAHPVEDVEVSEVLSPESSAALASAVRDLEARVALVERDLQVGFGRRGDGGEHTWQADYDTSGYARRTAITRIMVIITLGMSIVYVVLVLLRVVFKVF